ncbi:MAG: efflux RND transporter periplasmic adaptor subunit [Planctomycetota bacterium]
MNRRRFALFTLLLLAACAGEAPPPEAAPAVRVRVTPARTMEFTRVLAVAGVARAQSYAVVSARTPGVLDQVHVDEGEAVRAGETVLFTSDRLNLEKAQRIAQQQVAVSREAVSVRRAELRRLEADLEKARLDHDRYQRLYQDDGAVSADAYELQRSRLAQVEAAVAAATAAVSLAQRQAEQAAERLAIATKDLDDSAVRAPISGTVSQRHLEPGEMAGPGVPVVRIDDCSTLEVSGRVADIHFDRVVAGTTQARIRVGTVDCGLVPVSYRSPTVSEDLRTFEVRARLTDPPPGVVPGRLARLELVLERRSGTGVPADSPVARRDDELVFVVADDRAQAVAVHTGLRTGGWVELRESPIAAGAAVVSQGQDQLDDGDPVRVVDGRDS